ncbi:MAG: glycine cleavage system protein GcvH [Rhodospirillaceae bacterium]|jgi:glycine cleavage system H protein|nr:glycine cleavage system protein GcvH [Rhodospirillaceae bacterium]MBT5666239.1 glycine cleavage system protein GcvH [Rhodospirillaceae bacterium]MBT5810391.1 glycine cleavage system protein GcvH [Rhodospirillaceae bacterium]
MTELKFSEDHEWIEVDGDTATVGITDYAQEQLGDIVFVDLPETGTAFAVGDDAAVVESVKAASEIYAPLSGEVVEVNEDLEADPSKVNESAESNGWFFKMTIADSSELEGLMDRDAYDAFIARL